MIIDDGTKKCVFETGEHEYTKQVPNRCGGEVTFSPDPYQAEIYDDYEEVWMCEDCRQKRRDDI